MNNEVTLKALFSKSKSSLVDNLKGLSLPKDAQQIQVVVTKHLGNLFENDNDFRQNLTEAEDYILISVLRLLQSQQSIADEIAKSTKGLKTASNENMSATSNSPQYVTIAGAGVGAIAGGLMGTLGAIAGAIAGAAISTYFNSKPSPKTSQSSTSKVKEKEYPVNTELFTSIVENICDSIDGVIATFRVQVKRIKNIYDQREAPSLIRDYATLVEQVANVYNVSSAVEGVPTKLKQAIYYLAESLENYNLKIENGKIVNL